MIKNRPSKLPQICNAQRRATQSSFNSCGSRRSSVWDGAASNSDVGSVEEDSDFSFLPADPSREQARRVAELHEGVLDKLELGENSTSWEVQDEKKVKEEVRHKVLERRSLLGAEILQAVLRKVHHIVAERRSWFAEDLVQEMRRHLAPEKKSWMEKEVLQELQRVFMERRFWHAEEILYEVRRVVMDLREEALDDDILERRRPGEGDHTGSSYYIVLPENGVPAVEALLSSRVRAELLNDELQVEQPMQEPLQSQRRSLEDGSQTKKRTKPRNPWYVRPSKWYSGSSPGSPESDGRGGRQHDDPAGGSRDEDAVDGDASDRDDEPRALTRMEKETLPIVEAYRQSLKGHRLPHFLQ